MAFKKKSLSNEMNINLVPMIDVTSFILLSLAILNMSMKKEASLDNVLKLPPVLYASKQTNTQLQIFVLPAAIQAGGYVNADSTGLVAFFGKSTVPLECPNCKLAFRNAKQEYIPNILLDQGGRPIAEMAKPSDETDDAAEKKKSQERPPAYLCSRCKYEISPYLKLDEIPNALRARKKEVVDEIVQAENYARQQQQKPPMTEAETKKIGDDLPLMIKADALAFYGRILQVVNMSMDTSCDIKKFAFVSDAAASLEAQKKEKEEKLAREKGN
ncbi:MAG: hypothetical protein V1913_05235 [Fibrobacterota bacterium]